LMSTGCKSVVVNNRPILWRTVHAVQSSCYVALITNN